MSESLKPVHCVVSRSVLVAILELAAREECSVGLTAECERLAQWAHEVERGERVSIATKEWLKLNFPKNQHLKGP